MIAAFPTVSHSLPTLIGVGIGLRSSSSMFSKSEVLQVNKGRSLAIAVAAVIASNARALDVRPLRRSKAATRPKERRCRIEGKRSAIGLGLLEPQLAYRLLPGVCGDEWDD